MKTNEHLPRHRQTGHIVQLAALLLLSASFCYAQDASCKVVADAQMLFVRTPHHTYATEVRQGHTVLSEAIATSGGMYWEASGVWHKSAYSAQEFAQQSADNLKQLRNCHHVADEMTDAKPTSKFSFHNDVSGGDETVWIAKGSGAILRSEVVVENMRISSRYEYSNVQAPANVR